MLNIQTPDQLFGSLFTDIQTQQIFKDSKTFVDALPKADPQEILKAYQQQKESTGFDLKQFVTHYFALPAQDERVTASDKNRPVREHIQLLWDVLARNADHDDLRSSLLALPHPYIVPGGRFREIYYWDSYFTMLGLAASSRADMISNMVSNFSYLIDKIGFIPNGNRTYFCSRSQAPFFALMVELLAETKKDQQIYVQYLSSLTKEYEFWMAGSETLTPEQPVYRRVIKVDEGFLNRYWDDAPIPRQESYVEDVHLAAAATRGTEQLYRDIRAACESGWDFSSRWFVEPQDMATIRTTEIVPVDLNVLLFKLESVLALACDLAGDNTRSAFYQQRATQRKQAIRDLFFDTERGFFTDLVLPGLQHSQTLSLAGVFPLFLEIATTEQASAVAGRLEADFLKAGGWVTTLNCTGQQWDSPNGWAPLQWITYQGLNHYGFSGLARKGAEGWINNNLQVYQATGKLVEKYNVEQSGLLAGGGEYEIQDGFGWTNGVLLALLDEMKLA